MASCACLPARLCCVAGRGKITHFSPAATDGNEAKRSGCLGRGDSLLGNPLVGWKCNGGDLPKIRMTQSFFSSDALRWIIRQK